MADAAYPYEPVDVRIHLFGERSLRDRQVRAAVVDALLTASDFTPQLMGPEGVKGAPFDRESLCDADWDWSMHRYQLRRDRRQAYRLRMSRNDPPVLEMTFPLSRTPPARLPSIFAMGDCLAEAFRPRVGWVHIAGRTDDHHTDPVQRDQDLMDTAARGHTPTYVRNGAGGLGLRTYLGPAYADHLAPLLTSLPAPATVTPLPRSGTVRVDLTGDPWTSDAPTLHASWHAATAHLAPAGCFSLPSLTPSGRLTRTLAHPHPTREAGRPAQ